MCKLWPSKTSVIANYEQTIIGHALANFKTRSYSYMLLEKKNLVKHSRVSPVQAQGDYFLLSVTICRLRTGHNSHMNTMLQIGATAMCTHGQTPSNHRICTTLYGTLLRKVYSISIVRWNNTKRSKGPSNHRMCTTTLYGTLLRKVYSMVGWNNTNNVAILSILFISENSVAAFRCSISHHHVPYL